MAAVEVTISGALYDKTARTMRPVVLIGEASLTGLGVGGGPIYPPPGSGPVDPGYGVPITGLPHPEHPIVLPPTDPPPTNPPDEDGFLKAPSEGGWGYHQTYGWLYNPAPDAAGPKR